VSLPPTDAAGDALTPPPRYAASTFDAYRPETEGQALACTEARRFAARVRRQHGGTGWRRGLRRLGRTLAGGHHSDGLGGGLYLVGPVGTGKTHLLAAIYHAVSAAGSHEVPAAFVHSSRLFRATARPEDYARAVAARARVLLIDEVELDDPAAEVRLIGVLKALRRLGVVVAATSNAEPDRFVSGQFGRDRLERFISEEFRRQYHVVFVGGDDYRQRQSKTGRVFVGPAGAASAALREAHDTTPGRTLLLPFAELLRRTTEVERTRLAAELTALDALFLDGVSIRDTDDALRLLRVMDDLYAAPRPPVLYASSEAEPAGWFRAEDQGGGLARGVAEKFARTTSRVEALAEVVRVG